MPRAAVVFAVAIGVGVAAASPSRTAAAPKQHHESLHYRITLTNSASDPRLKAKPQQDKKAVVPHGSVRFRVDGSPASQGNARLRKR
jgi:hypothetical protein